MRKSKSPAIFRTPAHPTDVGGHAGLKGASVARAGHCHVIAMQRHEEPLLLELLLLLLSPRLPPPPLPSAAAGDHRGQRLCPARLPPPAGGGGGAAPPLPSSPDRHRHSVQAHELGHHAGLAPHHALAGHRRRHPAAQRRRSPVAGGGGGEGGVVVVVVVVVAEGGAVHGVAAAVEGEARVLAERVPRRPEHAPVRAVHARRAPRLLLLLLGLPRRRLLEVKLQDHLLQRHRRRRLALGDAHGRRRRRRHGEERRRRRVGADQPALHRGRRGVDAVAEAAYAAAAPHGVDTNRDRRGDRSTPCQVWLEKSI